MRKIIQIKKVLLITALILVIFTGCEKSSHKITGISMENLSFRDVPGITEEEIRAIEALQKQYTHFTYAMVQSTEAFLKEDGEIGGFSALFCEWLSGLFGISFEPVFFGSPDLFGIIQRGEVDFSGEIRITEERRGTYIATDPIALRSMKMFRLEGSEPINSIAMRRLPRFAFIRDTASIDDVAAVTEPDSYETVLIDLFGGAYGMLQRDEIDALIILNPVEAHIDYFDGSVVEDFFPLVFSPVSMVTVRPELAPIISVVQKALDNGAFQYFNELYKKGYEDYRRHKLFLRLTEEEKEFLRNTSVVPLTTGHEFFPISFFNKYDRKWEGSAFDVLNEVEKLTGLSFEIVNDQHLVMENVGKMLLDGSAHITPALIYSEGRRDYFLWPKNTWLKDRYALISKQEYPNIGINEIPYANIGLIKDAGYTTMFRIWFQETQNTREYATHIDALNALERGEVDMVMATISAFLIVANYYEMPGYKANFIFEPAFDITFGFNRDQAVLCSIVDKALSLIETDRIVSYWETMTYDYQSRLLRAQRPWLIGAIGLSLIILALVFILFARSRNTGKQLEKLVKERTGELELKTSILKTMFDSIPDVVFCKDLNLRYTQMNKVFMDFLGIDKKNILDKTNVESHGFPAETVSRIKDIDHRVMTERKKMVLEEWIPGKAGVTRLFETIKAPLTQNGDVIGLIAIARDITERKAMEEKARAASHSKSAFLANMSHEIRTPMNSIVGFSELALDDEIAPNTRDYLNNILQNADGLLKIINDILDISKIESGKMELEHIPFDLHEVFTRCQTAIIPKAMELGVTIQFYAEPSINKKLLGDPTRLRQILLNFLSNAVKFSKFGTVKQYASIQKTTKNTVEIKFEIKDNGIGMTAEQTARIYEPFSQADSSTTRQFGGTGLGIPIAKNMIELMGGKLVVESTPGAGSNFSFNITFETIDVPASSHSANPLFAELEKPIFRGEILICEDNLMNQHVVRDHLARIGLQTAIANNGSEAVDMVKKRIENGEKRYDLIFMDIHMPVMDGLEAASKITELNTGTPIVAMTANIMSSEKEQYKKHGMPECIGKPFTSQELWRCLLNYLTSTERKTVNTNNELEEDEVLQKMLRTNFLRHNQTKYEEVTKALEADDIKLAHRLVHTLKSNAGQLGKGSLQKTAGEIEDLLKDGKNLVTEKHLNFLRIELTAVLNELAPLAAEAVLAANKTIVFDREKALELASRLENMLKRGNPESIKLIDEVRATIPECEELIQQIEDFDFEMAFSSLAKLSGEWK